MSASLERKKKAAEPPDPHAKLVLLVTLLCNSGGPEPDPELFKALKRVVRGDDGALRRAHGALLHALKNRGCGPRLHAVTVCDELFSRSALFRTLLLDDLDVFLRRGVGNLHPDDPPLPGPPEEMERLVARSVQALDRWTERFGAHYPRLGVARRFVADTLGSEAPAARAAAARREEDARAQRAQARLRAQWRQLEGEEIPSLRLDVEQSTVAIVACLGMLLGVSLTGEHEHVGVGDAASRLGLGDEDEEDEWEDVLGGPQDDDRGGGGGGGSGGGGNEVKVKEEEEVGAGVVAASGRLEGGSTVVASIHVSETSENAVILGELRGLCRTAAVRLIPALSTALSLLAKIVPIESSSSTPSAASAAATEADGAVAAAALSAEARAAAVNTLAAAKRALVSSLTRCRMLGVPFPMPVDSFDEPESKLHQSVEVGRIDDAVDGAEAEGGAVDDFTIAVGSGEFGLIPHADRGEDGDDENVPSGGAGGGGDGDNATLDALLARAARRQRWLRNGRGSGSSGGGQSGAGGRGRPGSDIGGGSGDGASAGGGRGSQSVQNRARRILASRVTAHNATVMQELGEAGVDRRDVMTGASGRRERVLEERESHDAAARLQAQDAVHEAKRRKEAQTPQQRLAVRLKAMGNKRRN